jgi:predicted RNA polymerase sigma factor
MQLRSRRSTYLSLDQEYGGDGLALSERLSDSKPSPEEVCSDSEVREQLLKLSKRLSPTQRKTFQLRDLDGLTTKETAHRLRVPEGMVKAQVARARLKLSRIIYAIPHRQRFQTISRSLFREVSGGWCMRVGSARRNRKSGCREESLWTTRTTWRRREYQRSGL